MSLAMTNVTDTQEEWLKVLGKGMVTLPKKWRTEMGIESGDIVKAKKTRGKVIIEVPQPTKTPYRIYSDTEINEFLKDDRLPQKLAGNVRQHLSFSSRP